MTKRNSLITVLAFIAVGYTARRLWAARKSLKNVAEEAVSEVKEGLTLSAPESSPATTSSDEHLHVSLGDFLHGQQLHVG